MQRVASLPDLITAQLASDTLESAGIPNHIFNANAVGALGEVPFTHAFPEIWVADDAQADSARALLAADSAATRREHACPRCGEINPGNFLSCWQCGGALAEG
jgi:hypothetical protein